MPQLSDKLKKKVWPRRSLPWSVKAPDEKAARRDLARVHKLYVKGNAYGMYGAKVFGPGVEVDVQPELRDVRAAAHALLLEPTLEAVEAADLEVLAVAECMLRKQLFTAATVVTRGLRDALDASVRCLHYDLESQGDFTKCVFAVRVDDAKPMVWRGQDAALPLRHAVCAASDGEYEAARAWAETTRARVELVQRALLAHAFPDEPWAAQDLRSALSSPMLNVPHHQGPLQQVGFLLSSCGDAQVAAEVARHRPGTTHWQQQVGPMMLADHALNLAMALPEADAVELFAETIPALLVKPKHGTLLKTQPRDVATAMACFPSQNTARHLAAYVGHRVLGTLAAAFFQEHPEYRAVLEAEGSGKAAAALVAQLRTREEQEGTECAPMVDVPAVLRETPWRPRKGRAKARVIAGLQIPEPLEEHIEISEQELKAALHEEPGEVRDMTEAELAEWRERIRAGYGAADYVYNYVPPTAPDQTRYVRVPREEGLQAWNAGKARAYYGPLGMLARFGTRAIDGLLRDDWIGQVEYEEYEEHGGSFHAALRVVSPRMAPVLARAAARRKRCRSEVHQWLRTHPEVAALGLIPEALAAPGKSRKAAEGALRYLVQQGHAATVRHAGERYGAETLDALEQLLEADPLKVDRKPPKAPDALSPDDLPAVSLRDGRRLPKEARDALLEMLRTIPNDELYPGFELVREACDTQSLGRMGGALFEQWELAGANGRHDWMLHATVRFPHEGSTRKVALAARGWAHKNRTLAERGAEVLALLGSDLALMHLSHMTSTTRFDNLKSRGAALLEQIATERGLSRDQLGDRIVPDLGLDPDGLLRLDFGPRQFVVGLDETLAVVVRDTDGRRLASFPRINKADDPDKAKAAVARYKAFRADAKAISARELARLERAMAGRRSWKLADFERFIAQHPVTRHIARGLVWEATAPAGRFEVRVAEDGSYADLQDDALSLPADSTVRIAHPVELAERCSAWGELLADYELLQPFEQLGRATFSLSASEAEQTAWAHPDGQEVSARRTLAMLEIRGWRRSDPGHVSAYLRRVNTAEGALEVELPLSPAIDIAYLSPGDRTTLGAVRVCRPGDSEPLRLGQLDAVAFSEVARDVDQLLQADG